jgi:flagellar export protein FliJ
VKQRFVFRFERLARVRSIAEQEARTLWSQAERAADDALAALRRAETVLEQGRADVRTALAAAPFEPRRVLLLQGTLAGLARAVVSARATWRTRRTAADAAAAAWRARRQELESLERLRERTRERHLAALAGADARAMDEIAIQRDAARSGAQRST